MPKKVSFRVVSCSGWEDQFPAKQLEVQSPFVRGWRSPRYCPFPQEVIIRLEAPARIRKLQILSHQYMIASKLELYIGQLPPALGPHPSSSLDHTHFRRLGYISLSDNEKTGFRSRELKSVNLDVQGQLIKLVLHQNHVNRLNLFNQVSLVALNVIVDSQENASDGDIPRHVTHGHHAAKETLSDVVHSYLPSYRHSQEASPGLLGAVDRSSYISPMDDLAFAIAQDPETAQLIRQLDSKKETAVKDERFDLAKQLKQIIAELQKVGEVLCRLEVEKRRAIEREDYDTAKQRKLQSDELRYHAYKQLGIPSLLNGDYRSSQEATTKPLQHTQAPHVRNPTIPTTGETTQQSPHHHSMSKQGSTSKASPLLPPIDPTHTSHTSHPGHTSHPAATPTVVTRNINDERPLPALANKSTQQQQQLETGTDWESPTHDPDDPGKPEPLSDKQLNEVPHAVEVFGMDVVKHVYAKQFSLRERGLQLVQEALETPPTATPTVTHSRREAVNSVRATCEVLRKALHDKVFSSFTIALGLLQYLVKSYCKHHKLGKSELSYIVEKMLPVLLVRTGDMAPRVRSTAIDAVIELAQHQQIKSLALVGPLLVQPLKQHTSWRLAKGRVELLERFVRDVGMSGSELSVKTIMEFLCPCLEHTNGEVRDAAAKLTLEMYKLHGREVRPLLPVGEEDVAARKNPLWKTLFEGFNKFDGIPTPMEQKAAILAAEKAKKDEIQKLQAEVNTLKELAAQGQTLTQGQLAAAVAPPTAGGVIKDGTAVTSSERPQQGLARKHTELDRTCVFCAEKREDFTDAGLEGHYLSECPMLHQCKYCPQVVEIAGLTKHWLEECEAKEQFRECPRCKEAVRVTEFDNHTKAESCLVASQDNSNRCPLCHCNIPAGDEGWRSHLMRTANGCAKNPRKKKTTGRILPRATPAAKKTVVRNPQAQKKNK